MERLREPNKGLMSPPGGKLHTEEAESPAMCAVRESSEECSMITSEKDWILIGVVTEKNYPGIGNIMIFLMRYKNFLNELPPDCNEGGFHFIHPYDFTKYKIPLTDTLFLWEKVLKLNGEPFMTMLDCSAYPDIKQVTG